jgi:hypothetical protein
MKDQAGIRWFGFIRSLTLGLVVLTMVSCSAAVAPETGEGGEEPVAAEPTAESSGEIVATFMPTPAPTAAPTALPVLTESRRLNLEWPPKLREGDSGLVKMTLEIDDQGNLSPTAQIEGNVVRGETVVIQNLYDTHNVVAEARLDMAGVEISPEGEISEPLRPGQSATFFWNIHPPQVGRFKGTVWLHLRFIPLNGDEPESRTMISAQVIDVETVNFLGLGGTPARLLGGVGTLVGSILGLDNVIPWVWGRFRKKSRASIAR